MSHLFLCRLGDRRLRGLSSEINKLEQLIVVRYFCGTLAVFLPLKHSVGVELELERRGDEGGRWLIVHSLECTKVLLHGVVKAA